MAGISNARETAYYQIRNRIIHLDLKPGEVLNDKALAEEMGMSRTPVREAILMLSMAKLVVVRPQSGTFVAPIDLMSVEVEQFARYALEKEMIQRACKGIDSTYRNQYEENLRLYQFYIHSQLPDRKERGLEIDNDFHRIAFQIAGMEHHFEHMMSTLHHVERFRILSLMVFQNDTVYHDHLQILQAIIEKDAEAAGKWTEIHMNRYKEDLKEIRENYPEYF